ncbi:exodeoxyribonuclease X C-terminal domain-containing protein [Adhaeribacter rhizoryzae]|uniref:Exodeoxyribonuclease X-like C-terminal domain-containing protein n=1 Tax=Adhaeribacter rhizoryzae TaxID=2607907 RepID=A0A5M6D924_9BACT|nr:hypothetical protein [Adhaeribacter rhizoryzae]KAA5542419.1 hypothetical protein F0145_18385 [Adhaeribacter rhizoryzae]
MKKNLKNADFLLFTIDAILPFGKYCGKIVEEVCIENVNYLSWCIINIHNFTLTQKCFDGVQFLSNSGLSPNAVGKNYTKLANISNILKIKSCYMVRDNVAEKGEDFYSYNSNIFICYNRNKFTRIKSSYLRNSENLSFKGQHNGFYYARYFSKRVHSFLNKNYLVKPSDKKVKIKIKLVDFNDFKVFSKYQEDYFFKKHHIFKMVGDAIVVLYVDIDYSNFEYEDYFFENGYGINAFMTPFCSDNVESILFSEITNLDQALKDYVKYREKFPSLNLNNLIIQNWENKKSLESFCQKDFQIELGLEELTKYVYDWCVKFKLTDKYLSLQLTLVTRYLKNFDGDSSLSYAESEKDAFDALTDGQYGTWEDYNGDLDFVND